MREMKFGSLWSILFLMFGISVVLISGKAAWAQASSDKVLTNSDCIKCHAAPPADIAANGAGHKKITCQDCHAGHRPSIKDNIPKCSRCHMGKPHYEFKGCTTCHNNPHTPLKISFAGNLTEQCLSCHAQQIRQLRENKSRHTSLDCSFCHTAHRKIPGCLQCHKPHMADMANASCKRCHKPHMPKVVTYAADVPSKDCSACHKKVFDLLTAGKSKHKTLDCAFCHQAKHKMIPSCQDCHGTHHSSGILAKFPKCGECHNIAHDLNH